MDESRRKDERVELTEFLLARIAEDEERARAATPGPWIASGQDDYWEVLNLRGSSADDVVVSAGWPSDPAGGACEKDAAHIADWNPARVLAKCAADRRIVGRLAAIERTPLTVTTAYAEGYDHGILDAARFLALPYADHPDYDEEWKP